MLLSDIDALATAAENGDEIGAEAAASRLSAAGAEVVPQLWSLARSPNPDLRWWAVRALAQSPDASPEMLTTCLEDASPDVRSAAALGLAIHVSERTVPALLRALQDRDGLTAELAGRALENLGAKATEPLLEALSGWTGRSRVAALRVLSKIGDERSIPALLRASEDDTALGQYWAREGLERLGLSMMYMKP